MKYVDINLMDQANLHDIICPLFVGDDSNQPVKDRNAICVGGRADYIMRFMF